MNAEIGGKLVAQFIEKQWPNDRSKIYEILKIACNKAWQEGKWFGMTAEFYVNVMKDSDGNYFFISPYSHPILLAINSLCKQGGTIRDSYFMFHKNGYGDIRKTPGCDWNKDFYDVGTVPYIDKNNINFDCGVKIGVRPVGKAGINEIVNINGGYSDGKQIYTYKNSRYANTCGCSVNTDSIDTVNGVEISVIDGFNYINNINFSSITSITKSHTKSPIEVIAINPDNTATVIARLEPNQRFSEYRKYIVPSEFRKRPIIHGLFKIGKQEDIIHPTDEIMIKSEEALIALAKGVHLMYYKEEVEAGAGYILNGLSVLEKEKRESDSSQEFPIQVINTYEDDLPESLSKFN
jgi:hypothetical protein